MSGTAFFSLIERLEDWQARNSAYRSLIYMSEMVSAARVNVMGELLARS
jgi:hypothetical protein